jgi:hypothetical protein
MSAVIFSETSPNSGAKFLLSNLDFDEAQNRIITSVT